MTGTTAATAMRLVTELQEEAETLKEGLATRDVEIENLRRALRATEEAAADIRRKNEQLVYRCNGLVDTLRHQAQRNHDFLPLGCQPCADAATAIT